MIIFLILLLFHLTPTIVGINSKRNKRMKAKADARLFLPGQRPRHVSICFYHINPGRTTACYLQLAPSNAGDDTACPVEAGDWRGKHGYFFCNQEKYYSLL